MKTYAEKATTFTYVAERRCDLCGRRATRNPDNWDASSSYDVAETELRLREGSHYPECGYGTEIEIDLCPTCFRTKLLPWLTEQGATIKEREWDY